MKVCKFGGSSLADAARIAQVCDIVAADADRRIVVVSAPGKRESSDIKVTDLLLACAEARLTGGDVAGAVARVVERYAAIQRELGLDAAVMTRIAAQLEAVVGGPIDDRARYLDAVKAAGEDNNARLVAEALSSRGVPARYTDPREAGLLLSPEYGRARVLPESYENLARLADAEDRVVFPGFFGYTREGQVVTFSRGGSDITGSILAAAVHAELYENFTDVDAVLSADPTIVPDAAPIAELTYREMRELAYAGFGVLHDEAIVPAVQAMIPICIRNTQKPEAPGTLIVTRHAVDTTRVVGIASSAGFCSIYVSKYLMNREVGFGRKLMQILEEENLSYEHMPSGIDNISVVLEEAAFTSERAAHVLRRIRDELEANDVSVERGLALIMIVGEGMRFTVGLAATATRALADAGVNIEMMNQGSSEISMMFGVKAEYRERAVNSLYKAFFEESV